MGILEKLRPTPRWKHTDPSVRAAAVYDIGPEDAEALRALAREHADVAVGALERINDAEALGAIAQRARNKVAARRAKTKLRGIEGAAQQPAQEEATPMSAADRQRALDLVHRVEAIVTIANPDEA